MFTRAIECRIKPEKQRDIAEGNDTVPDFLKKYPGFIEAVGLLPETDPTYRKL
jgi:antibiotic biosynthesis monooxygenase (ABM) superfamily enzyme